MRRRASLEPRLPCVRCATWRPSLPVPSSRCETYVPYGGSVAKRMLAFVFLLVLPALLAAQTPKANMARRATHVRGEAVRLGKRSVTLVQSDVLVVHATFSERRTGSG